MDLPAWISMPFVVARFNWQSNTILVSGCTITNSLYGWVACNMHIESNSKCIYTFCVYTLICLCHQLCTALGLLVIFILDTNVDSSYLKMDAIHRARTLWWNMIYGAKPSHLDAFYTRQLNHKVLIYIHCFSWEFTQILTKSARRKSLGA